MTDLVMMGEGMYYDPDYEELDSRAKRCPFCGCEYVKHITREKFNSLHTRGLSLECLDCECEMWWFPKDVNYHPTFDVAVSECLKKWNARAE